MLGWTFYIFINSVFFGLSSRPGMRELAIYFFMLPAGIAITHFYRYVIVKSGVLEFKIPFQLLFVLGFSFLKGVIFFLMILFLSGLLGINYNGLNFLGFIESSINFSVIFFLWNAIYFGFHYFRNYKLSEINALRYLAASKESELHNLRAQLNPHFIFNCMNSIRALIDENPDKARNAVTQLSNILRSNLLMNKSSEIPLREELNLVKDYLQLEKIRYEERLNYDFKVDDNLLNFMIPPFILQTQVENSIKHGISKLSGKGYILVDIHKTGDQVNMTVSNSGRINTQHPETGVGFVNSGQRLELLYGREAGIRIYEREDFVFVEINIPLKKLRTEVK